MAQLIAPNATPVWLPHLLQIYGSLIAQDREIQEGLPSKADLRRKLLEAKNAVERITTLLNDLVTMTFIQIESNVQVSNFVRLQIDLHDLTKQLSLLPPLQ